MPRQYPKEFGGRAFRLVTESLDELDFTTRYARAYFAVISVLADTDNPFLIPESVHQRRASTFEARPPPRGHYL